MDARVHMSAGEGIAQRTSVEGLVSASSSSACFASGSLGAPWDGGWEVNLDRL